jgi:hypothetical protein
MLRGQVRQVLEAWVLDVQVCASVFVDANLCVIVTFSIWQRREPVPDDPNKRYQDEFEASVHDHKLRFVGRSWSWQCDGQEIGDGCKRRGNYQKADRFRW